MKNAENSADTKRKTPKEEWAIQRKRRLEKGRTSTVLPPATTTRRFRFQKSRAKKKNRHPYVKKKKGETDYGSQNTNEAMWKRLPRAIDTA